MLVAQEEVRETGRVGESYEGDVTQGSRRPPQGREWACEPGKAGQGLLGNNGAPNPQRPAPREPKTELASAPPGAPQPEHKTQWSHGDLRPTDTVR